MRHEVWIVCMDGDRHEKRHGIEICLAGEVEHQDTKYLIMNFAASAIGRDGNDRCIDTHGSSQV
jgi:hypothetical protein